MAVLCGRSMFRTARAMAWRRAAARPRLRLAAAAARPAPFFCRDFQLAAHHAITSTFRPQEPTPPCAVSALIDHEALHAGGGADANHRHVVKNGKILVRDRIAQLLDAGTDFFELSAHAGYKLYKGETVSAAGVLTGVGVINGVRCMIIANDATVKGGTIYPIGLKKQLRAQDIAMENHLPCVYLVDSGGAFLPMQDEIFNPGGRIFYNEVVVRSSVGANCWVKPPQINQCSRDSQTCVCSSFPRLDAR